MATRVSQCKIRVTSLTLKTPFLVQKTGTYLKYKPRYGNFVKISKILLPWQPGSVTVKFKCYHLIPQP